MGTLHVLARAEPVERDWAALIERTARGDTAALAAIYDGTASMIFGLALRILGDRSALRRTLGSAGREAL